MSSLKKKSFNISTQPFSPLYVVRLEDAEQTLAELKQKLQQLLNEFPKSEFVTMGNLKAVSSTFKGEEVQNWKKKLEELLKVERETD